MNNFDRILFVDDTQNTLEVVTNGLQSIGLHPQIEFICPAKNDAEHVLSLLPKCDQLDDFDLALIDLELSNIPSRPMGYAPEDLLGGSAVLPYLRESAPWLPVIAISKLFGSEGSYFMGIGGGFGFDGHVEKHVFSAPQFNPGYWSGICRRALERRIENATQQFNSLTSSELKMTVGTSLRGVLDNNVPSWSRLLKCMFSFAQSISIKRISGGFSGAFTLEINAIQIHNSINTTNRWFVKISDKPFKLHAESMAHRLLFFNNGLEYARSLPLMYNHVIKIGESAAIAYQYANGTDVASSHLNSIAGIASNSDRLFDLLSDFYRDENFMQREEVLYDLLCGHFKPSSLESAYERSSRVNGDVIGSIVSRSQNTVTEAIVRYTSTLIHGDLHLDNILLGPRDVFIDFAKCSHGPLVADLAKFVYHCYIIIPELRDFDCTFDSIITNVDHPLHFLFTLFSPKNQDGYLFDVFLTLFIAQVLSYPGTDQDILDWVHDYLS